MVNNHNNKVQSKGKKVFGIIYLFFGFLGGIREEIPGDRPLFFFFFFFFLAKLGSCLGLQTSEVAACRRICPVACGILVSRSGIEPESLLHWKVDSLQLYYQGSPLKLHLNIYVPFKEKLKGISRHRHLLQSLGYDSGKSYSCFKN